MEFDNIKMKQPIPITIITGFLGSGKTSFLSRLLTAKNMSNSAVIINEFGEFGLDHLLVEQVDEQIFELPNGCLCCSARNELVDKMLDLAERRICNKLNFSRLIIETSGISDPVILIHNIWNEPRIRTLFQLSNIITLVSAVEPAHSPHGIEKAGSALAISDTILISKSDLLPAKSRDRDLAHLLSRIELLNTGASCHILPLSVDQLNDITNNNPMIAEPKNQQIPHPGHSISCRTLTLTHPHPLPVATVISLLDALLSRYREDMLRIKGLALTTEIPDCPLVIQAVGSILSPSIRLNKWIDLPQTRLTVIHTGNIARDIIALFEGFLNIPRPDQPDRTAIVENPLSIPGLGTFRVR